MLIPNILSSLSLMLPTKNYEPFSTQYFKLGILFPDQTAFLKSSE